MESDQKEESESANTIGQSDSHETGNEEKNLRDSENEKQKEEQKKNDTTDEGKKTFAEEFPDTPVIKLTPPSFVRTPPQQRTRKNTTTTSNDVVDDGKKTFAEELPDTRAVRLDPPSFVKTPPQVRNRKISTNAADDSKSNFAEELPDTRAVRLDPPSFVKTPPQKEKKDSNDSSKSTFAEELPDTRAVRLDPPSFVKTPPQHRKRKQNDCNGSMKKGGKEQFDEEFLDYSVKPPSFMGTPSRNKKNQHSDFAEEITDSRVRSDNFAEEFPSSSARLEPPTSTETQDYKRHIAHNNTLTETAASAKNPQSISNSHGNGSNEIDETCLERQSNIQPGAFRISGINGSGGDDDDDESYYRDEIPISETSVHSVEDAEDGKNHNQSRNDILETAPESAKALSLWSRYWRIIVFCGAILFLGTIAVVVAVIVSAPASTTFSTLQTEFSPPKNDLSSTVDKVILFRATYSIKEDTLDLPKRDLTGTIPTEIGRLVNLKYVDLGNNELSGTIPSEMGLLTMLKRLWLDNNELSGIPSEIGMLTDLTSLTLYGNDFSNSTVLPGIFDTLSKLTNSPLASRKS
eukprot:CAMPEP_0178926166 /NCGR_PEP_ID=MMETSP0786-20121207/18360_1 /TAXON_ID=186022 /ORGANISM="Thalassionema frauenfeldii, Strain CCMP 1798" /LENGTH=574 /DNA_ID=CAMNT_0020601215 /DNA_START=61 /DNA_END=1786 /DNA_ORIENTATION=+